MVGLTCMFSICFLKMLSLEMDIQYSCKIVEANCSIHSVKYCMGQILGTFCMWLHVTYNTLYIYCMLVKEIWKFIHPRVSYSLRATPKGNMILVGEYIFIFPEPACYKCFIIQNETIHVKYCWQTYFKSIGTLFQTFKNHSISQTIL